LFYRNKNTKKLFDYKNLKKGTRTRQIVTQLFKGDITIRYQVHRDLFFTEQKEMLERISKEGWGMTFLEARHPEGHWGKAFYNPK